MNRVLQLILLFLFSGQLLSAQPSFRFKTLSLLQGLSQSTVNSIIQDRQGFIWIATQDGLNRYDGYTFKIYKHNSKDSNSISDNYIQALFLDKQGKIWIGTYGGGLSRFDPATETFTNFSHDPDKENTISNDLVMSITEDSKGILWIGTSSGLNRFDPRTESFRRYLNNEQNKQSLSSNKIRCLFFDSQQRLWIGTADNGLNLLHEEDIFERFPSGEAGHNSIQTITETGGGNLLIGTSGGGLKRFDIEKRAFQTVEFSIKNEDIHIRDIWSIRQDENQVIWAGTYGAGLVRHDLKTRQTTVYKNDPTDQNSLTNNIILCSFKDRQGFMWVGTLGGGLSVFHPGGSMFTNLNRHATEKNSLNENVVMSILDDEDRLYIGTYGGGLNIKDKKSGNYEFYTNGPSLTSIPSNIIRCIFKDSKNRIWIGSYDGGLSELRGGKFMNHKHKEDDSNTIGGNDVWCIREDKDGMLWIGTWGGGLNKFDPETGIFKAYKTSKAIGSISNDKVISLHIDGRGRIWAGTNGGGLNLFDPVKERFIHYRHDESNSTSISSDRIRSIVEDKSGHLWIGTDGGGLNKMKIDGTFEHFTESEGLPNNVVYGILDDEDGHLWLSTNNGLCRFDQKTHRTRNFDVSDGIQGNEFNQGACYKARTGEMYFGGINGITIFNPRYIRSNTYVPPVVLTSVKLFGKELESDTSATALKTLSLSYDQNFFSFEFSALDFTAPEKNQYACKMEGFDNEWILLGNKRFVSYTNLDPGTYTFRVIASNNENFWNNEGYSIRIIIAPPFYKTAWFYALLVILAVAAVYLFIFLRTRNLRQAKQMLEEEVSLRTREVVQQKEIIEGKNKDITDSINYARRIQRAIFPSRESFSSAFPESFIYYRPKDIVSGDFYWMERFGDDLFVAVVDCTGHGVPGAFMSIVGNNLLNQAVNELGISKPSLILNEMNKGLAKLIRNQSDLEFKDGMDMGLCAINMKTGKMQFSGANNPVWIIRKNRAELEEYKGDKQPVGSYMKDRQALFTNHEIQLEKGDCFYLSSDGYADQFGGPQGKKMKKSQLKEKLIDFSSLDMQGQGEALKQHFESWRGSFEQVDDVLIIGVRV